jgi:uncharacterized protein (DUF433 family)
MESPRRKSTPAKIIRERRGGELYEYQPLGKYVVAAAGVCGGRPTFKHTRLEVAFILDLLAAGWTIDEVVAEYKASRLSAAAVKEAIQLARQALVEASRLTQAAS